MAKVRLDDLLIEQGYFPNRDAVVRAVSQKRFGWMMYMYPVRR